MCRWVVENELARGRRPGYLGERGAAVRQADVDAWVLEVKTLGIKSIICLLGDDQLGLYNELPNGLIPYYREVGFSVEHVPVRDHQSPPLSDADLDKVWKAYQALPKPVLVHCSAGIDRTGMAVEYIQRQMKRRLGLNMRL